MLDTIAADRLGVWPGGPEPPGRRRRPKRMRSRLAASLVLVSLAATSCAEQPTTGVAGEPGGPVEPRIERGDAPPDITVTGGASDGSDGSELVLRPHAYCWGNGCVDGVPPDSLPEAGAAGELVVEFPVPDWTFQASFRRAGDPCARTQSADLERLSPTTYRLAPLGEAGSYDIELFGRPEGGGGDVITALRWTTLADGPPPEPEAWLAVLADNDGQVDSYGVEFSVSNLAASPERYHAEVTVTAAGGAQYTFAPHPEPAAPEGCDAVEGGLSWYGPEAAGKEAAAIGQPPFTYTVELDLDGVTYVGTAAWPGDEHPDQAPSVPLTFEPPLPAVGG